ncbi:MAG: OmpA family protein [Hyphomicrobiales bacterium]|nr:OmpA family protein [Hyphomicrobiales bacterium]
MRRFGWLLYDGLIAGGATLVAGLFAFGPIAADVTARTTERLRSEGRAWATVASIDGRDITLAGAAPEPQLRALAVESADRVFGVRVVTDATTVLPLATPYPFDAERTAAGVKLTGAVPNEETRALLRKAAAEVAGGRPVVDETVLARGAPADFAARAGFAVARLADLTAGQASWSGDGLSIGGDPLDFATWQALERRLASELPAGAKLVADALRTPAPPRWSFSATTVDGRVVLDGFLPDAATRDRVLKTASAAFPGGVEDRTILAPGAADGTAAAIDFSLAALSRLVAGGAKIDPAGYTIAGKPKSWEVYRDLEDRLKAGGPGGLRLVSDGLVPVAPSPYRFALKAANGGATVEGHLPDAAARDRVFAALKAAFGRVDGEVDLAPGAPKGFVDTLVALAPTLARFSDLGFDFADGAIDLKGAAPTAALGEKILAKLRSLLPTGISLRESAVSALPPPPQVDAATCQADLAAVQTGDKIHFDTGKATLREESVRVLDGLVVAALKCTSAHVAVEGHTDSDGDETANQALSEARARAVVEYLVEGGIAADRLAAIGFGETRPIADNATPEGRQQNRRIEFRVE